MPIRVLPARLDWLTALVESDAVFAERFGVPVEPGWIGFPEALPFAVDAARDHDDDPWGSHLFFDDDCYPDPDFVTDWLEVFAQHDIGFASGMIPPYDRRYSDMGCTEQPTQELVRGGQFVRRGLIQGSNMAFAHQCLEATGFFDERFGAGTRFAGEEWDLALRASAAGWSGGYFPQPRVAHDHRRTEAEGLERMLFYDYGAGAVYAKHALRLGGKVMRDYLRELNALRRHPARRAMLLKGYKDFTALKLRSSRAG